MCGIAGVAGPWPVVREYFEALLTSVESRGGDAAGVAFCQGENVWVVKGPDTSFALLKSRAYKARADQLQGWTIVIGHTRYATRGTPRIAANNHPIITDNVVGVHNGCLHGENALFRRLKLKREGQVDSEVLFRLADSAVSRNGWDKAQLARSWRKVQGSMAVVAYSTLAPWKVVFAKRNNPICLVKNGPVISWASYDYALQGDLDTIPEGKLAVLDLGPRDGVWEYTPLNAWKGTPLNAWEDEDSWGWEEGLPPDFTMSGSEVYDVSGHLAGYIMWDKMFLDEFGELTIAGDCLMDFTGSPVAYHRSGKIWIVNA